MILVYVFFFCLTQKINTFYKRKVHELKTWKFNLHVCNVADRWKKVVKAPSMEGFVMKPDLLSFHIASKIPISESKRQELLEIDGTSYRLRREIELLESFDKIQCKSCQVM